MRHFEESDIYWGDTITPYSAQAGARDRLSARSVKIFADGELFS